MLSQELPLSISLNQDTYRNAAQFARAGFEAAECCLPVHYHAEVDLSIFPAYLEEVSRRLRALLDAGSAPIFQIANRHALEDLLTAQYPWPWYGQLMNTAQTIAYMLQVNHWMEVYRVELV